MGSILDVTLVLVVVGIGIDNALVFARGGNRGNLGCTIGALGGLGLLVTHIVA